MTVVNQAPRDLLIDDNPVVRDMLLGVLTVLGYAAEAAKSEPEAPALFEQGHYDMILTDLSMPGVTGWDVLEVLRQRDPKIPVVIVRGLPVAIDEERVSQPGVALAQKPLDVAALSRLMTRMLEERLVS